MRKRLRSNGLTIELDSRNVQRGLICPPNKSQEVMGSHVALSEV
jgi:hypothetical protein